MLSKTSKGYSLYSQVVTNLDLGFLPRYVSSTAYAGRQMCLGRVFYD